MPEGNNTSVVLAPQFSPSPTGQGGLPQMLPTISPEAYKTYEKLIDPEVLFMKKLTGVLYGGRLLKTSTTDPNSPLEGYRLVEPEKPNMSLTGYTTVAADIMMILGEDKSTTVWPRKYDLAMYAARKTMSEVGIMMANREEWEFTNYTLVYPFGLTLWNAIVAVHSRSIQHEGRNEVLMDKVFVPTLYNQPDPIRPTEKTRFKWLNF
jgi:hypothetical protein